MLRLILVVLIVLFAFINSHAGTCGSGSCVGSAPWTANSLSYADVNACINSCAAHGDVVNLPAGTATWSTQLSVGKTVHLKGAGIRNDGAGTGTKITSGLSYYTDYLQTGTENYMIVYPPLTGAAGGTDTYGSNQTAYATYTFKISDLTLDGDFRTGHLLMHNKSADTFKFHIYNTRWDDCIQVYNSGTMYNNTAYLQGSWKGLFNSNYFYGNPFFKMLTGDYETQGAVTLYNFKYADEMGTENGIYFEDNYVYNQKVNGLAQRNGVCGTRILNGPYIPSDCDTQNTFSSSNCGSSVVQRYNTFVCATDTGCDYNYNHSLRGPCALTTSTSKYYNSGYLMPGRWYTVKATTSNNYFCASCPVNTMFRATSALALSSSNQVWAVNYNCNMGSLRFETYGNYYEEKDGASYGVTLSAFEDGRSIMINNKMKSTKDPIRATFYKQWWETLNIHGRTCPSQDGSLPEYMNPSGNSCTNDTTPAPANINRSAVVNTRYGITSDGTGTLVLTKTGRDESRTTIADLPVENTHFFVHNANANCTSGGSCTSGTGCGTTKPTSCTKGTFFWKTDQPCSYIQTTSLGKSPTVPMAGELYRCTATNVWTLDFVPYTYPHPWRGSDTVKPVLSNTQPTGTQSCSSPATNISISVNASDSWGVIGVNCCLDNSGSCVSSTLYGNMDVPLSITGGNSMSGTWGATVSTGCNLSSVKYNCKGTDLAGNISENVQIQYATAIGTDTTNPSLTTAVFDGTTLTLTFDEPIKNGGAYSDSQWNLTVGGTPVGITCAQNWNTDKLYCTPNSCVSTGTTLLLDWDQPAGNNSIQDLVDLPLADITDKAVTNNATESCGTPTTTSLFRHDETPPVSESTDVSSNLGVQFQSSVAGRITHVWYYQTTNMYGENHVAAVWKNGTLLASKAFGSSAGVGWKSVALDSAVDILANTNYMVSFQVPYYYPRTGGYFSNGYTNSTFTVPTGGGFYTDDPLQKYPETSTNTNFWVDFTFAPVGTSTWNVTFSNASAEGAKCDLSKTSAVVNNGATTSIDVTVAPGWKASISGCSGSTSQTGNVYTHTTGAVSADCTVTTTCTEIRRPRWKH